MKYFVYSTLIIFLFFGCVIMPQGTSSNYIEKPLADVINVNLRINEAYANGSHHSLPNSNIVFESLLFRITSEVFISINNNQIIIFDEYGNKINNSLLRDIYELNKVYNLPNNPDLNPDKKYKIYYIVETTNHWVHANPFSIEIMNITIERIEGLMTYQEYRNAGNIERNRAIEQQQLVHQQEEEMRRQTQQEEREQRKINARALIQRAIATRNADTIMQSLVFLAEGQSFTTNRELLRGETLIDDAYLAIAKAVTRNNNIQLEWLGAVFNNAGDNRLTSPAVLRLFNQNRVYYQDQLIVYQRLRGSEYIINTGYNDARRYIVLRNVTNIIEWDRKNWVTDVFLQYTGETTLEFQNGNDLNVPVFNVIYQYNNR